MNETSQRVEEHGGADPSAVIETLQSIIIAFVVAFVFKHFVAEAYVIPTGSMAPTLLGAHIAARGPDSGYEFDLGPDPYQEDEQHMARPVQQNIRAEDPMLRSERYDNPAKGPRPASFERAKIRMGDRIFVQRYLYSIFAPRRFDVVVFKYPVDPSLNFIKRLVGLPNEEVWLADGDVFARPLNSEQPFEIQRKPEYVQRAVWQPVYDADYVPMYPGGYSPPWQSPWMGRAINVTGRIYRSDQPESALIWRNDDKPIVDYTAYNSIQSPYIGSRTANGALYGVSDVRIHAAIRPANDGLKSTIRLAARQHLFEASLGAGEVSLRFRPLQSENEWTDLARVQTDLANLSGGALTRVEFWHVDQALKLWLNDTLVAEATYKWGARERLILATGLDPEMAENVSNYENPSEDPLYRPDSPQIEWSFAGAPVEVFHLRLDRDLYYRPTHYRDQNGVLEGPALATAPSTIAKIGPDEFFMCGDNSPASKDGRTWEEPTPWIREQFSARQGLVPRKLILGKAFFVYYPSPEGIKEGGTRFVPNFGEMRLIR